MNNKIYGIIYTIRNKINNKLYIGQTSAEEGFEGRYRSGKWWANTSNQHLKNSAIKYGIENFEVDEVFDVAYSQEELNKLEYMYIKIYNTINNKYGYNKRDGGDNGKLTQETRNKMKENRANIQGENNPMYGKHHTKETKNKISEKVKGENHPQYGIPHTKEWKLYMSKLKSGKGHHMFGKHHSDEAKAKIREHTTGEKNHNYGKHLSEEVKSKLSEYQKGDKNNRARKVICLSNIEEIFTTILEASEKYNISKSSISKCCVGRRESAGKHKWMYYEDYIFMVENRVTYDNMRNIIKNRLLKYLELKEKKLWEKESQKNI